MAGSCRCILQAALVLLLALPALSAPAGTGTLVGIVVGAPRSADGIPLPLEGALVEVVGTDRRTFTDSLGTFQFDALPAGEVLLRASRDGLQAEHRVRVEVGPMPTNVSIRLAPTARGGPGEPVLCVAFSPRRGEAPPPRSPVDPPGGPPVDTTLNYLVRLLLGKPIDIHDTDGRSPRTLLGPSSNFVAVLPLDRPQATALHEMTARPFWLAFDREGRRLFASTSDGEILVLDATSDYRTLSAVPTGGIVTDLQRTGDRLAVAVMGTAPAVVLVDAVDPGRRRAHPVAAGQPRAASATPDGAWILAALAEGEVLKLDAATGEVAGRAAVGRTPAGAALSPDARLLFVANSGSSDVSLVDVAEMRETSRVRVGAGPEKVAVSPDGGRVAVACRTSGDLAFLDGRTGALQASVRLGREPVGVAFSPDGRRVFATCVGSGEVWILDAATHAILESTPPAPHAVPWGVAVKG